MSVESLGCDGDVLHVTTTPTTLVDGLIHLLWLSEACLYRIDVTVVLRPKDDGGMTPLTSPCVNVSMTVSTAPTMPATPPPPARIRDFRNGSLLVGWPGRRRLRDVGVVVSTRRLIVIEYPDHGPTLSQLVDRGLTHTYDRRTTNANADLLVGHHEALRRNQSFYVTGEVGLNAAEFMIGDPFVGWMKWSNPLVDVSRTCRIYVVQENSLDGIHRRAVSEFVVLVRSGAAAGLAVTVVPWWGWLLIVLAILIVTIVLYLAVLIWWRSRLRGKDKRWSMKVYGTRCASDDPAKSFSPGGVSLPLAVSYLDSLTDGEDRHRRHGRVSSGRPALDSRSDTGGEWSFVEPRPIYDSDRSAVTPPPRRSRCVPVNELRAYCERRLWANDGRALADEFSLLPDGFTGPVNAATRPSSVPFNRSQDCLPYDHNRVRLLSGQYINASVVRTIGRRRFVVTQHPTDETLAEFWQLVWERNVDVIVALTSADEPDCRPYWPAELSSAAAAVSGNMMIELTGVGVLAHFVVRELLLERRGEVGRRRVAHWQYTWCLGADPETSIPCHPADFVDFIQRVRDDDDYASAAGVMVHCALGGGRCGLYLAVDALLDQGVNTGVVDVVKCVSLLRTERCALVRSLPQYNFVYQCLCEQFDHPQTRFSAQHFVAQPRPGEFQLVFMPAYFDPVRQGQPVTPRRPRNPLSMVCLADEDQDFPAVDDGTDCEADYNPAVTFDGFIQRSVFVVSQCPRPLNADGFWEVVTEAEVSCIVSLGVIAGQPGHELVVPQEPGCSVKTQHHLVECQSVERRSESVYVVVDLSVTQCDGERVFHESRRPVKLFELVSWSCDWPVPTADSLLQFTTLVRCWQRRCSTPLLVFGTAEPSVGCRDRSRAAVFVALWRLMEQAELDAVVDVFSATRFTCLLLPSAIISEVYSPS